MGTKGAEATEAECGVFFRLIVEEAERLVGSGIQSSHDDLLARERGEQGGVFGLLVFDRRGVVRVEEEELGAEQANTFCALVDRILQFVDRTEVREERDGGAVREPARANWDVGSGSAGCEGRQGGGCFSIRRIYRDDPRRGIDDDRFAVLERQGTKRSDDGNDRLLAGENRRVRGRSAVARNEREYLVEV